ncbi:MAG: polysaccharide biosynthesis protein [Nitrospira bacterium HGW-Nitrospira-1]|nr:MAG: polysaccharide biosynthesis protein [Nitrospira bacterium HGW-Nitrospira-1]
MPNLLYPSSFKRSLFFILSDILIIILSLYLSFLLRFEFALSEVYNAMVLKALPFFIIVKLVSFGIFRVYRITWRQVGINELFNIVSAVIVSELVLVVLFLVPSPLNFFALTERFLSPVSTGFPRSIFLIDLGISILLISGLRISKRFYLELVRNKRNLKQGLRTIIIGAGNTGEMVLRDIAKQENSLFYPIGLLDDDSRKLGTYIHRVKVLAKADKLKAVVRKYAIEAVIIAIPSLNHKDLRRMYDDARECGIKTIKIVPKIYDFHKPDINIKTLEDLKIEDLIGRQMVKVDYKEIKELLQHKTVFISGAGGSIGSEIVMQVCGFNPSGLMLFDIDETALHNMELKVRKAFPDLKEKVCFTVGNILDEEKVKAIFKNLRPQIVFHAAAYKHVPMMEHNPEEAVKTNMFGTYNLADAASRYDAEKFIVISTDKAVRPTSIMGATKRMAEHICCAFNGSEGQRKTEFISVRFGNVLGSRGSVLPMFLEQLKNGDALTVTHKDMQRYFMTIPEAVSLVLQASAIGEGGEVLVLDMGEPVKIIKLAEELIRLNGLMPYRDIEIKFTGMRPGEKLFEEILTAHEGTVASRHEKVFIAKNSEKFSKEEVENILEEFKTAIAGSADHKKIKDLLRKNVKHFGDDFIGRL